MGIENEFFHFYASISLKKKYNPVGKCTFKERRIFSCSFDMLQEHGHVLGTWFLQKLMMPNVGAFIWYYNN